MGPSYNSYDMQRLKDFLAHYPIQQCQNGETILEPTEPCQMMLYLHQGIVAAQYSWEGEEQRVMNLIGPEQWVGSEGLIYDLTLYRYVAVQESHYSVIPMDDIKDQRGMMFLQNIAQVSLREWVGLITKHFIHRQGAKQRLLATLIDLRIKLNCKDIPVSHQDLADITGLDRSYVSQILKQFSDQNLIESAYNRIGLPNLEVLKSALMNAQEAEA